MIRHVARMTSDFRANPFAHGLILLVPAIQFGLNYFTSVSALLFAALAFNMRMRITPLTTGIIVVAVSCTPIWNTVYLPEFPNMPREARLAVGMLLLAWGLNGLPRHNIAKFNGWWPLLMLLALTFVALLQAVAGVIRLGMVQRFEDAPFQNGAFNVLFAFGWLGFAVLWVFVRTAGSGICALFLMLLFCQNVAPFDLDKIVMAIFAIHLARDVRAATDLHTLTRLMAPRRRRA